MNGDVSVTVIDILASKVATLKVIYRGFSPDIISKLLNVIDALIIFVYVFSFEVFTDS